MASFDLAARFIVEELIKVNGGISIPALLDNVRLNNEPYLLALDHKIEEIEAAPVAEGVVNVSLYGVSYRYCFFHI